MPDERCFGSSDLRGDFGMKKVKTGGGKVTAWFLQLGSEIVHFVLLQS